MYGKARLRARRGVLLRFAQHLDPFVDDAVVWRLAVGKGKILVCANVCERKTTATTMRWDGTRG